MLKKMLAFLFLVAGPAKAADVVLDTGNFVTLRGEVTEESVAKLESEILESSRTELYLYIASPGGSIIAGQKLGRVLRNSGKKITCVASIAVSMAFVLFQDCDNRYVMSDSIVMQHVASYGIQGEEPNNWSRANFLRRLIFQMDQDQAKRLNMTVAEFKRKTRDDWWLVGEQAVEQRAADKVVTVSCTQQLSKTRVQQTVYGMFAAARLEWSGCPMVEYPVKIDIQRIGMMPGPGFSREVGDLKARLNIRGFIEQWRESGHRPEAMLRRRMQ